MGTRTLTRHTIATSVFPQPGVMYIVFVFLIRLVVLC